MRADPSFCLDAGVEPHNGVDLKVPPPFLPLSHSHTALCWPSRLTPAPSSRLASLACRSGRALTTCPSSSGTTPTTAGSPSRAAASASTSATARALLAPSSRPGSARPATATRSFRPSGSKPVVEGEGRRRSASYLSLLTPVARFLCRARSSGCSLPTTTSSYGQSLIPVFASSSLLPVP